MLKEITKYSYNDVTIIPSPLSDINHRSECIPFHGDGFLPIFAAPMSTVVNVENYDIFEQNHIHAIIPRNVEIDIRMRLLEEGKWVAFSLKEFEELFTNPSSKIDFHKNVLIDVANGHMKKIYELVIAAKDIYHDNITVMVGNIAHYKTYKQCCLAGVDYVRCSIGTGSFCLTSSNLGVHYPMASLIDEIRQTKNLLMADESFPNTATKIIADGGIRNYSDVIKALALGADYVMIGGLFSAFVESAAPTFSKDNPTKPIGAIKEIITNRFNEKVVIDDTGKGYIMERLFKLGYGMASAQGQKDINGIKSKTSEGLARQMPITTSISKWSENMADYLRSAMSYLNMKSVYELHKAEVVLMSPNTAMSINK